jgi:membrane protein
MANLWTRGGLSWSELVLRTWQESWEDAVFGQAARLAFYHFIAIFPSLLLLFFALVKFPAAGSAVRTTLATALSGILPHEASALMQSMIEKLNATAASGMGLFSAALGSVWAAINGTWAVMTGLNTAYEVKERRPLWKVLAIAFALTASIALMFLIALGALFYGTRAAQAILQGAGTGASLPLLVRSAEWTILAFLLLMSFALFYRFGPNLYDREWQWSTPGAVLALLLWLLASELVRLYFERFHTYHVVYGPLEGVAMLLLWLYFTSGAILIGGEMNSEIEKATEQNSTANQKVGHAREGNN